MEPIILAERPGIRVDDPDIKKSILNNLYMSWNKYDKDRFPGCQPVSIERKHFSSLRSNQYWVCAKTDGVRYIMHFHKNKEVYYCVLINRKNELFILDVHAIKSAFYGTILDGELVLNKETRQYDFLIYDVVCVCGMNVSQLPHSERLNKCKSVIMYIYISEKHNINLQLKTFASLDIIKNYNDNIVPHIPHEHDGLIFTPENRPIVTGTNYDMFKWKPKLKNTVDFWIEYNFKKNENPILKVMKGKYLIRLHDHYVYVPKHLKDDVPGVFECSYNGRKNWYAMFKRNDKHFPNHIFTMTKTLLNIEEDIRIEEFENIN
tara:strand:- start:781 stop:1737 length:957 start_codon:yes stop_codon:yes gene_type:complete